MTDVVALARTRKLLEGLDISPVDATSELTMSQQLELLIAPGASPYGEITRLGRAVKIGTTAAIAAVVAVPTTAVMLAIYNNEPDGGRTFVIDWVGAINVASTAVATQAQMLVMQGQVRETAPTDAALAITKMNGIGTRADTNILSILNATPLPATTGLAANWLPWGASVAKTGVAATPGYGLWAPVEGKMMCPPGRYFAVHVIGSVVGETFVAFIGGHMRQLTLG